MPSNSIVNSVSFITICRSVNEVFFNVCICLDVIVNLHNLLAPYIKASSRKYLNTRGAFDILDTLSH